MQNTYNSNGTQKICTVIAVDIRRKVCKCLSDTGEILSEVKWVVPMGGTDGTGLSVHPVENSRVLVDTASGFPFIVGAISTDSTSDVKRTNVASQRTIEDDIADYSTVSMGDIIRGPGTPLDQRPGDNLFTADGGGIMGLLRSGTALIKSSPLAQIVTSRFGDVVRVVSRNWEHFTDVDETYKTSIRGKVYSLRNVFRTPEDSRSGTPSFSRLEGNIPAAEAVGKDYAKYIESEFPGGEVDEVIVKESTYNNGEVSSTWVKKIDGSQEWDIGQGAIQVSENADGSYHMETSGGAFGLHIDTSGNVTLTTSGTLDVTAKDTTFNLANCKFITTGTTEFESAGNFIVKAPTIQLN